jgi:hypothetical protein
MSRNQVWNQVGYKSNNIFSFSKQESTFHSLPIAVILFVCWTYSYPEVGMLITKVNSAELKEQLVIPDGIPAVPRNRKFSEFRSEPFRGRENNPEFRSAEQK